MEEEVKVKILNVEDISKIIKGKLESGDLNGLWLIGLVDGFRQSPFGHLYFSLIDKDGSVGKVRCRVNCTMWRSTACELTELPEDGMLVKCYGHIEVYEPHGKYQFIVNEIGEFITEEIVFEK